MTVKILRYLYGFIIAGAIVCATGAAVFASAESYSDASSQNIGISQHQEVHVQTGRERVEQYLSQYMTQEQINQLYLQTNTQFDQNGRSSDGGYVEYRHSSAASVPYSDPFYTISSQPAVEYPVQYQEPQKQYYPNYPFVPLAPLPQIPVVHDAGQAYVQCVQGAVQQRENALLQANRTYFWQYEQLLQERAQSRLSYWQIADNRWRRDTERQVERDFRDRERVLKKQLDQSARDASGQFRNQERGCDRSRRDAERRERDAQRALERQQRELRAFDASFLAARQAGDVPVTQTDIDSPAIQPSFGGPLPSGVCGDVWLTPGVGFIWDTRPIQACVL